MRSDTRLVFIALVVVTSVGLIVFSGLRQIEPLGADPDDLEQVARGKAVYLSACGSCHGESLEGEPNWRRPLSDGSYPAPPYDGTGHTWHHSDELLFRITKHGGQEIDVDGFKRNMPSFMGLLSDEEIWAVLAYIKSSWPKELLRRQLETNQRASG